MRKHPTRSERNFWKALRAERLRGYKFRRQEVIGNYIVDFVCHEAKVIVELDGDSHLGKEVYDQKRKEWLESQDYKVLRFGTEIIHWSKGEMLGEILVACQAGRSESPPPSVGEG